MNLSASPKFLLLGILASLLYAPASAQECKIETLDGEILGRLIRINDQEVEVLSNGQPKAFSLEQLLSVTFHTDKLESLERDHGEIRTKNGSIIRLTYFESSGDQIKIAPLFASELEMQIPGQELQAILLPQLLSDNDWQFWEEACEAKVTTDQLIVRGRSSGSLRSIQGFIESIGPEGINFQLEGDSIFVSWNRIFGAVLFAESTEKQNRIEICHNEGSRLSVDSVSLEGDLFQVKLMGEQIALPIETLEAFDFSSGKIFWLDDLPILKSEWSERFDVPSFINFEPRFGQSFQGLPLALMHLDTRLPGVTKKKYYEHGICLRSGSIVQVRIPATGRRFTGMAGIDPQTSRSGAVDLEVLLGDELLLQERILGGTAPLSFDLMLPKLDSRERILTIKVKAGEDGSSGDNLHVVNARITK